MYDNSLQDWSERRAERQLRRRKEKECRCFPDGLIRLDPRERGDLHYPSGLGQDDSGFAKIWSPIETILKTGADVFEKIAPYTIKRSSAAVSPYYPGYYPTSRALAPSGSMYPYYDTQAPASASPSWLLPAVALGGGVLLITMMNKR